MSSCVVTWVGSPCVELARAGMGVRSIFRRARPEQFETTFIGVLVRNGFGETTARQNKLFDQNRPCCSSTLSGPNTWTEIVQIRAGFGQHGDEISHIHIAESTKFLRILKTLDWTDICRLRAAFSRLAPTSANFGRVRRVADQSGSDSLHISDRS